jgi:hypothetical protein
LETLEVSGNTTTTEPGEDAANPAGLETPASITIAGVSTITRHVITVRETSNRHGLFEIALADGPTLPASRTPLLSAARYLISAGASPDAVIEMRHAARPDVTALSGKIGAAAKLTVREDRKRGPSFEQYKPLSGDGE